MSHPQQVVQACHASLEAARTFLPLSCEHPFVVVCGIRDEPRLFRCIERLEKAGVRYRAFFEPDLGDQLTAVATEPVHGSKRSMFRNYQLLTVKS
ncbi:MAG TPA: hypothetical protein VGY58_15010 [Gemmataceae bacterium]|nr:hypothetical protein [Gemmataceae bacterium]